MEIGLRIYGGFACGGIFLKTMRVMLNNSKGRLNEILQSNELILFEKFCYKLKESVLCF